MRLFVALVALTLVLAACTAPPASVTQCGQGELLREFGGCCPDVDANGVCDVAVIPEPVNETVVIPEPEVNDTPIENTTIVVPPEPTLSVAEEFGNLYAKKVKTFSYYVDTREFGRLWVWQDQATIRYIAVEHLMEVERNTLESTTNGYGKDEQQFIYRIENRDEPAVSYVEYKRSANGYTACYIEGITYTLDQCIEDYPNGNPIVYGGVKFTAPKDPVAWLAAYQGKTPQVVKFNRTHRDVDGTFRGATEVTYLEQNGSRTTFLVDSSYGAPYTVTMIDRYNVTRATLKIEEVAFNSQSNVDGNPRLEAKYEYR